MLLFSIPYLAVVLHPTESLAPHGADHGEVAGLSLGYVIRRCLVRIQVVRRLEVYTPGALLAQGGEPMREMAVRIPAEHEADDALIVRDLPYRVQYNSFTTVDSRGPGEPPALRVGPMIL